MDRKAATTGARVIHLSTRANAQTGCQAKVANVTQVTANHRQWKHLNVLDQLHFSNDDQSNTHKEGTDGRLPYACGN